MKTKRVLYLMLLCMLALFLTMAPAGTALGWGNGEGNLSSYGAHDWIVSQAYALVGGSAGAPWLVLSTALASCDDPDYMPNKVDAWHNYHPLVSPPDTMPVPYPYGGAPDQVKIGYEQIQAAITAGQYSAASKAFGILAHYYADVCQPMHTDEALSEGWTHSRYEMAVDRYTRSASYNTSWVIPDGLQPVLTSDAAHTKTVEAATTAHPYYRTLLTTYANSGMNTTVLSITKTSLNNAVNGLADILAGLTLGGTGGNIAPVAKAGASPTSGNPPLKVVFSSAGSNDPDGSIVGYLWAFGDGATSTAENPTHDYAAVGTYTATLTVTDNESATGTAAVTIKVTAPVNLAPTAVIGADPTSGLPPLEVAFSSTGSNDPDGSIVGYLWAFGDGATSTAENPTHVYANAGTYTARLTVTDNGGATGTATVTIRALPVMKVQSITFSLSSVWYYRTVRGSVLITDTNGAPVSNATVSVSWTGTTSGTATATTGTNGVATFSRSFWASSGKVTLTVTGVSKTGCSYDPAQNLESQDSISF